MEPSPRFVDERARLAALRASGIVEMPADPACNDIARMAALVARCPIARVTFLDEDHQWFKASVGIPVGEHAHPRAGSFCDHVLGTNGVLVVTDLQHDARFARHPQVVGGPGLRFYAGVAVRSGGQPIGSVCVLDVAPRTLDDTQREALQILGRQVETLLGGVVRDLTERRAVEAALRVRDRAIAASPSGITIADARAPDMPLLYANQSFERITGYSVAEVMGRNCRFLQGDERDQPALEALRAAIRARRECHVVLRNFRKDGTAFWNELTFAPVHDEEGELTHFIGVQSDVTARVQGEEDRAALADLRARQNVLLEQELARRTEQLLRADRLATLGTLAGGVGHELNNITQILLTYLTFVRERAADGLAPEPEDLAALDRAGEHVKVHAANLLALGRPGPDRAERVDLREVITTTIGMLTTVGRTRKGTVEVRAPKEPVPVTVNRGRIEQVVVNLVGNAVDALDETVDRGREGRVRISLRLDTAAGGDRVWCDVEDNGEGMTAETLAQIFEPYFTTKPPGRGTGLGLPVVRQIVEAYGGSLTVTSRVAEGTCFTFDLPMEVSTARAT